MTDIPWGEMPIWLIAFVLLAAAAEKVYALSKARNGIAPITAPPVKLDSDAMKKLHAIELTCNGCMKYQEGEARRGRDALDAVRGAVGDLRLEIRGAKKAWEQPVAAMNSLSRNVMDLNEQVTKVVQQQAGVVDKLSQNVMSLNEHIRTLNNERPQQAKPGPGTD